MSKFAAINVSDDESDIEEHTRELQIEECLKLFRTALNFQKDHDLDQAFETYDALFKIDVISDFTAASATVNNLRYLSYRNRGFLKFEQLSKDQESFDPDDSASLDHLYDDCMSCIEDLVTALLFGEGDTNLVELIFEFFQFFGNQRLTRLILEYELVKNDIKLGNDSNLLVVRRHKASNTFKLFLRRYKELLNGLNYYDATIMNNDTFINRNNILNIGTDIAQPVPSTTLPKRDLTFLAPLKEEIMANQMKNMYVPKEVIIDLSKYKTKPINVCTLIKELQALLPRSKNRLKRFYDHYYSTEEPIEVVALNVGEDIHESADQGIDPLNSEEPNTEEAKTEPLVPVNSTDTLASEQEVAEKKAEERERQRQRSSRRLNANSVVEEPQKIEELDFSEQERFCVVLNNYLKLLGDNLNVTNVIPTIVGKDDRDAALKDFCQILESWNHSKSEALLINVSNNIGVMEILNADQLNNVSDLEGCKSAEDFDISGLIDAIRNSKLHFHQVRNLLLEHLLQYSNGECAITDYKFSEDNYLDIKHLISCSDINYYTAIKEAMNETKNIGVALSIYEVLVDSYIAIYAELDQLKTQGVNKAVLNELLLQKRILLSRAERWRSLVEDLLYAHKDQDSVLYLRFEWCDLTYLQHLDNIDQQNEVYIKNRLSELLSHDLLSSIEVCYRNFNYIKTLNHRNVSVQLSKLNVLTTFSDLFKSGPTDAQHSENMDLLEKIVVPNAKERKTQDQMDMEDFIKSSTLELKLKLFQVLFDHFGKTNNLAKSQLCFEHVLTMLSDAIIANSSKEQSDAARIFGFIRIYTFFGEFADGFSIALANQGWTLPSAPESFKALLEFFKFGFAFCLHEDISKSTTLKISIAKKSSKSFLKLQDIVCNNLSLIFVYFDAALKDRKPEYVNDLLDLIHHQLGFRSFCGAADGKFLSLLEEKLVTLSWTESELEILQLIACRYHLQISTDGFTPADHNTKEIAFDKRNALAISRYVIPICFKKRNPMVSNMRSDIKVLLDSIYDAVGDPDESQEGVKRCEGLLDEFLEDTVLTVRFMKECFYGLRDLALAPGKIDVQIAVDNGLYYLQGINALNLFKLRKRSMQSRVSELDFVIKMFKQDLYCGSNRLESWFLLGQAYGFLVEDDLIWTSDKLTNDDKKNTTAQLQKKSLLCYLMAINQYTVTNDKVVYEHVSSQLWSSFGKELYNAAMEPMSALCFQIGNMSFFQKQDSKIVERNTSNPISQTTLLKILKSSFLMSAKLNSKDWMNFYYLAKIESKASDDCELIIEFLVQAASLARSAVVHGEPIFEPHYLMCSMVFKLCQKEKISTQKGLEYLQRDDFFKFKDDVDTEVNDFQSFALLIVDCLKQIIAIDKKSWQHKPHYRLANIYKDVLNDIDAAKDEILELINLKPTVKNLVTIWKPEFERPGKHFSYNFQYVMAAVDILTEAKDLTSMLALGKKLRRFGASIIKLLTAWNHATKKICDLIRVYAKISNGYSERAIATVSYMKFMQKAKRFNKYLNDADSKFDDEEDQHLLYLFTEFAEIKRMSNGFSQISYIDDTFYCMYLRMIDIYEEKILTKQKAEELKDDHIDVSVSAPGTPGAKSKLAKKDIAEAIKSLNLPKLPEKHILYEIRLNNDTASLTTNEQAALSLNTPTPLTPRSDVAELSSTVQTPDVSPTPTKHTLAEVSTPTASSHKRQKIEKEHNVDAAGVNENDDEDDDDNDVFHTPGKEFPPEEDTN